MYYNTNKRSFKVSMYELKKQKHPIYFLQNLLGVFYFIPQLCHHPR